MAGAAAAPADESSSAFSSSMRGTAGASDERSFRIFLQMESQHESVVRPAGPVSGYKASSSRASWSIYLYEGRRDRISRRFWESVTLSTDSCESSLSATVEIWENNTNQLGRTGKTSRQQVPAPKAASVEWAGPNPAVGLCLWVSPARPAPVGTG